MPLSPRQMVTSPSNFQAVPLQSEGENTGTSNTRRRTVTIIASVSGLLACGFLFALWVSVPEPNETPPKRLREKSFDCDENYDDYKGQWSQSKVAYCCGAFKKDCPGLFDCDAGYDRWNEGWSTIKKDWCCHSSAKGCETLHKRLRSPAWWCQTSFAPLLGSWCQTQNGTEAEERAGDVERSSSEKTRSSSGPDRANMPKTDTSEDSEKDHNEHRSEITTTSVSTENGNTKATTTEVTTTTEAIATSTLEVTTKATTTPIKATSAVTTSVETTITSSDTSETSTSSPEESKRVTKTSTTTQTPATTLPPKQVEETAEETTAFVVIPGLKNAGQACLQACEGKPGTCDFCGSKGKCCQRGSDSDPHECGSVTAWELWYTSSHHECWV